MRSLSSSSSRPGTAHKDSQRIPGGFSEDDVELSPLRATFKMPMAKTGNHPYDFADSLSLPPLPQGDSSLLGSEGGSKLEEDGSALSEKEMRRRLMDVESSFLPEVSFIGQHGVGNPGADDTFVFGATTGGEDMLPPQHPSTYKATLSGLLEGPPSSPPTPPELYRTPAPPHMNSPIRMQFDRDESETDYGNIGNTTSSLETMSSSPTAAAAARTVSRVVSMATVGGYETADDRSQIQDTFEDQGDDIIDGEATPRKSKKQSSSHSQASTLREAPKLQFQRSSENLDAGHSDNHDSSSFLSWAERPKFLRSRNASNRSSASSFASLSGYPADSAASDTTLGADFALQSGGAAPVNSALSPRPTLDLSRSTSLGSIASGVTGFSETGSTWERGRAVSGASILGGSASGAAERYLARLDEEERTSRERAQSSADKTVNGQDDSSPPATPRATNARTLMAPTDTVIAQHVRNIHVPASVAREYRENNRSSSPEKKPGIPTPNPGRGKKTLTLKEQSSTIDRLTKENFDLKLKVHYLNNALNERSEEGVKEMISENVELKAGLVTLQKEARGLRRQVRDLEKKLKEREDGLLVAGAHEGEDNQSPRSLGPEVSLEMEEEISYLRERVETYEVEIEKLRREGVEREGEKRRLAEIVRNIGERRGAGADLGAMEETDMWKDLLEAETARREQADEENAKLREEIWRLKNESLSTLTNNHISDVYNVSKRQIMSSTRSLSGISDSSRNGPMSSTLVEQLRNQNDELKREVGAQTSMLTSRNREREGLHQEIEDLKIRLRRSEGLRSVAGDSILDRSASRAHDRANSRASGGTQATALSDAEREDYENKNGFLRDKISELKLKNQELERQLEGCLDELDKADATKAELERLVVGYEDEIELATQDMQALQAERDEALRLHEQLEAEFDQLKNEAQTEIDTLEQEIHQKDSNIQQFESELSNRDENFNALQNEMRSMSESLIRLEDDQQADRRKMQELQQVLEDANRELEAMEKSLTEANGKVERLTVQQESSQGEIAFLREEQDGDKIKIGDLETALKSAEASLQDERERVKEIEKRLADERHQREVVGSQEKQEVQRMMNDLNREASTARDEARRLKKSLSTREIEAKEWKERLMELEDNLREALGDLNGTRSSLLRDVSNLQTELDKTLHELDSTKNELAEKDKILKDRDNLLESAGLESHKLADLLDKERHARRNERAQYEQIQRTMTTTHQTISQHQTKVTELENARQRDKQRIAALEAHYKEQLTERNNLLLALWNRLSTLCGTEWAHKNSHVNGKLPSLDVVENSFPGFSRNLLLAAKAVAGLISGFKSRIRGVERELWKEYQTLEHNLDVRTKKLERLEQAVHAARGVGTDRSVEIAKLRGENRLLKAELNVLNKQRLGIIKSQSGVGGSDGAGTASATATTTTRSSNSNLQHHTVTLGGTTLTRHHSTSAVETLSGGAEGSYGNSEQQWILRLRELERRLKIEREARVSDRRGALERLEQGKAENEALRMRLERERVRKGGDPNVPLEGEAVKDSDAGEAWD